MEVGNSPRSLTTKCRVKYRKSKWNIHEFEVWSGEMLCRVVVLQMESSLLVWLGAREAQLYTAALAVPCAGGAVATPLLGASGATAGMARRLATLRARPALVCCGLPLDRFTGPLIERGVAAEMKSHPQYF